MTLNFFWQRLKHQRTQEHEKHENINPGNETIDRILMRIPHLYPVHEPLNVICPTDDLPPAEPFCRTNVGVVPEDGIFARLMFINWPNTCTVRLAVIIALKLIKTRILYSHMNPGEQHQMDRRYSPATSKHTHYTAIRRQMR